MTAEGQRSPGCLIGGALLKGLKDVFWMMRARFRRNFAQDDPFEQPAPGSPPTMRSSMSTIGKTKPNCSCASRLSAKRLSGRDTNVGLSAG
jgi:hypothetical protein